MFKSQPENGIVTMSHINEQHATSEYFPIAQSEDGLFEWFTGQDGYVAVNCQLSGLEDNTINKTGWHSDYLQYSQLPENIRIKAVEFKNKVCALKEARAKAALIKEIEEIKNAPVTVNKSHNAPCPKCGTWCYGDCEAN
jgi:hypothetical protein